MIFQSAILPFSKTLCTTYGALDSISMDSSLVSQNRLGENCDMIPFNAIFCKFNNFSQIRHILMKKGIQYNGN